jgi:hypothetical protein
MVKTLCLAVLFSAATSIAVAAKPQGTAQGGTMRSLPEQYVGSWICRSVRPGYSLTLPNPNQPMANRTNPARMVEQRFSLLADRTYETPNATGHYSYDAAANTIRWLDGPHKETFTKTELKTRTDGAPSMSYVLDGRYYGCSKPKPR